MSLQVGRHGRNRRSPLAIISSRGERAALHKLEGCSGPMTVLLLHANGFCGLMYEPLVRRSSLSSLATVYALDMPGQGASPRPRARGTGSPGALESYGFLALAAVDWLRENGMVPSSLSLCAFGHSGGGLAALSAEQERPGTFRALYLYEPMVLPAANPPQRNRGEEEASTSSPPSRPPPFALSSTPSLEAGARRRRRAFGSREAALLSLRRKPPFSLFDAECARIYVEEGMVDDDETEGEEEEEGRRRGATTATATAAAAAAAASAFPTVSTSSSSTAVSLAASPEDEAAVYLEAGPLGVEAGRRLGAVAAPVLVAAGGDGAKSSGGSASFGGGGGGGGSVATRPDPSLHAPLARAAPRTARLLPRGRLEVYRGLGHLGPFENPEFVGERAAEAFARAVAVTEEEEGERERERESGSWRSLPPEREFELGSSSSSILSSKL